MKEVFTKFTDDGIGNRLTSSSAVLGDHTYTPNSLNQYATLTTGNSRTAVGRAPAAWNVQVAGVNASRIGEMFYRPLTASNATAPVWQDVIVQRDTGTPTMTRHFWHAKQTFSPVHDDDGNLTNDGRWAYSWDAENRLTQMETTTAATGAGHPYTLLRFAYDWQGHRIARHVWQGGTAGSPTFKSSHRWLHDGWNVVAEFTAPSDTSTTLTPLNRFTWGLDLSGTLQGAGGVGGLLVQTTVSGSVIERASYDGNGNIIAWTKSNAAAPTSRREYDAFGNTLVSEGAAPCAFGFSTKMQDAETGLYYYGYRYYDPVTGRWPSKDPIGEKGGVNLYGFVRNDSFEYYDYLGAFPARFGQIAAPERGFGGPGVTNYQVVDEINHRRSLEPDDGSCCEDGKSLNKVSVYVVNRGSPINQQGASAGLPQWTGGHIDLVIPGCGVGMVGFYGNQAGGDGTIAATFNGIPGTINIDLGDWTRSPLEGGRINYLAPEDGLMVNTPQGRVRVPSIRSYICEIKVCPADAKKMCQRAQQIRSNPGLFRMLGRNCSTMGCDILNSGGAGPSGISWIDNPQALQNQLGTNNCFYGYTALGPDGKISVQRATDQSPPPTH